MTTSCSSIEALSYPVAIIGAGPVGLAAAAHLVSRGEQPIVLEGGPTVGAHVAAWGHVQVFSPWRFNVDEVSAKLLRGNGWSDPDPDRLPASRFCSARWSSCTCGPPISSVTRRLERLVTRPDAGLPAAGVVCPQTAPTPLHDPLTARTALRAVELVLLKRGTRLSAFQKRVRVGHGS